MAPFARGLRMRLHRKGVKHDPSFDIVVIDAARRRGARPVEQLGFYDPKPQVVREPSPSLLEIGKLTVEKRIEWNKSRVQYWLKQGAQPTDKVEWLLEKAGIPFRKKKSKKTKVDLLTSKSSAPCQPKHPLPFQPNFSTTLPFKSNDPIELDAWRTRLKRAQQRALLKAYEPGTSAWLERAAATGELATVGPLTGQAEPFPLTPFPKFPLIGPSRVGSRMPRLQHKSLQRQAVEMAIEQRKQHMKLMNKIPRSDIVS